VASHPPQEQEIVGSNQAGVYGFERFRRCEQVTPLNMTCLLWKSSDTSDIAVVEHRGFTVAEHRGFTVADLRDFTVVDLRNFTAVEHRDFTFV
jgi:hypothetical protein